MELKAGVQLASAVCGARVVVVKAPADRQPEIGCGGQPMVAAAEAPSELKPVDPSLSGGAVLGKRYEADGLELLCTAAGEGTLTCDGAPMELKSAKPLPASD